jgi:putative CocE/NonD family hydrolase
MLTQVPAGLIYASRFDKKSRLAFYVEESPMKIRVHRYLAVWSAFFFIFSVAVVLRGQEAAPSPEKISSPGKYQGYSRPIYEEWVRTSEYVPVRDGTKLAVDIFRPSVKGKPVSEPLPVLWTLTCYRRAFLTPEGKLVTVLDQLPWMQQILRHGYVVAAVDIRGSGASFGVSRGVFTPEEAADAYDITEWLAAQPWSSGKIGMFGVAYLAITQFLAASTAPPHLVAIMPDMAMFDLYSLTYPGGVFQDDFISEWSKLVKMLDTVEPAAPVDNDPGSKLLAAALKEHQENVYPDAYTAAESFRDSVIPETDIQPYLDWSPHDYLRGIKEAGSGIAIYHVAGWFDMWPRDALTWLNNLPNPQKIIVLPSSHTHDFAKGWKETVEPLLGFDFKFDIGAEQLRWYDYWLKGINNGIMSEPPICYFTMGAPEADIMKDAQQWPLPEEKPTRFYFQAGPSGSVKSAHDGLLTRAAPKADSGQDEYSVDYTTTTGKLTRWNNGRGGDFLYLDMSGNDAKGLTYTSAPLEEDVEVTGHPVVHLWVSSTAEDGDFFAYLEEVDETGYSHYITEGVLRASLRKLAPAPYNYMGLPYHRSFEEDMEPLEPGLPEELVFDLLPTSNIFDAGHRLRLTVTCADQLNFQTPELSPVPRVSVYRNKNSSSYIKLPVISNLKAEEAAKELVLSTTLIVIGIIVIVILLFLFLRWRLKR